MQQTIQSKDLSAEQGAKQILFGLIGVYKKLNLYPASHAVYQNALEILKKLLDDFFSAFGNLRLRIERNNIFYDDILVYEGTTEPTDLAFLLHRDSILWVEFQNGLQLWEIDAFLKILQEHGTLDEDPADDIVTALWGINLPAILYESADLEIGLHDDIDISRLPCIDASAIDDQAVDAEVCEDVQDDPIVTPLSVFAPDVLSNENQEELWELSVGERDLLRQMIADEDRLDGSDYAIDAILHIMETHCLEEDIVDLLDTLKQELSEALIHGRFVYLFEAVKRLKKIPLNDASQKKWQALYCNQFFNWLATERFLKGLLRISLPEKAFSDSEIKALKRFLLLLDTKAITVLGPMIGDIQSTALLRAVMEVIGTMARSDFHNLEKLIEQADPALAARFVYLLGFLKDSRSRQVLSRLLVDPSSKVRMAALKAVLTRDEQATNEIFSLIDDPDEKARRLVLNRLGRERSSSIEEMLLHYLKQNGPSLKNSRHFTAVCRTLGKCGSEKSEPYLIRLLFKWPLLGVLRSDSSIKRQGAVAALKVLNTENAKRLIDRDERSFWRNIFRKANV